MKQQILVETYTPEESNVITEAVSEGNVKSYYLSGRFLSGEQKNRNGRIYPLSEIAKAVDTLNEIIKNHGNCPGELDHPEGRLQTSLSEISHVITEIKLVGNNAIGKLKVIDTPKGRILSELMKQSFRPDVSSRGAGSVNSEGVVEDYVIQTVDVVVSASGIGCSPQSIYESIDEYKKSKTILTLAEAVKEDQSAQKYFSKEITKFLYSLLNH